VTTEQRRARYLLFALMLFYTSSFVDRAILNILAQSIKEDLSLTDAQLGILGGIAFAALYAILGIPVARLAERRNRMIIISVALVIWSAMTMLCAAAVNFVQLGLARAGVGIGEAACTPCAHSLIADSFPPQRRATAMSVYALGVPLGTLLGALGGAWIADLYGWRVAFIAVGAPGLLLALIAKLTIKEPERGVYDPPSREQVPPFIEVLTFLWGLRTFRHLAIGVSVSTMIAAGIATFMAPFLLRGPFDLTLKGVALITAVLAGAAATVGTLLGGRLGDHFGRRDARCYLVIPAAGYVLAAGFQVAALLQTDLVMLMALLALGQACCVMYLGPTFGVLHNMVEPRMRATAVAIVFVLTSLIGLGLGPVLVGSLSDFAAARAVEAATLRESSFAGLKLALAAASLLYLWPAIHYFTASRSVAQDLRSR
jgi:MFS family permease